MRPRCGKWMPRAKAYCDKKEGHPGSCDSGYRERNRQYHRDHREERLEKNRQYYRDHREEELERNRQYRRDHREEVRERNRQYCRDHREEVRERHRQYRLLTVKGATRHIRESRGREFSAKVENEMIEQLGGSDFR